MSCVVELVPENLAQAACSAEARQQSKRPRPSRAFLRRSKRLSRKYSLALLAVVLLGIAVWDGVSAVWPAALESSVAAFGQKVSDEDRDSRISASGHRRLFLEAEDDQFTSDQRKSGAVILHCIGLFYMFIAIALVCDECFVPALEVITEVLDLSPDVAGATFMAAGGSAPEFFTSLIGAVIRESDIGTGTIIGSAVFNVLFVIGACALVAPEPLHLTWFPLARDSCFYAVDLLVVTAAFIDEKVKWFEAVILFSLYVSYATFMKFSERIEHWATGAIAEPVKVVPAEPEENEEESDEKWAKPDPARMSGQNLQIGFGSAQSSSEGAGTGEGYDDPRSLFQRGSSNLRSSRDENMEQHPAADRRGFRHKSIRVANHISLLTSGNADDDHKAGRHSSHSTSGSRLSEKSVSEGSDVQDPAPPQGDSTGGSGDPPPPPSVSPTKKAKTPEGDMDAVLPSRSASAAKMESSASASSRCSSRSVTDLVEQDIEEEDVNEPLSIMPPGSDGSPKDWFWYIVTLPILVCLVFTIPDVRREGNRKFYLFTFFMAMVWIAIFTCVMVWFATVISETAGIEEHIMGLTILAAGTSVPDLLTSMIVARQGHGDMAISSSIGSNIFDVTVGLPIPWLLYSMYKQKDVTIKNESLEIMVMLLLFMLGFTIATIVWHSWVMTKWMGSTLLFLYLLFEVVACWMTTAPKGSLKLIHV
jgi:K+-dependent Na+/Ca+ exchanger-like protein